MNSTKAAQEYTDSDFINFASAHHWSDETQTNSKIDRGILG